MHITINKINFNLNERHLINKNKLTEYELQVIDFINLWLSDQTHLTFKTSGTTGKPKKIRVLKTHLINSGLRTLNYLNIDSGIILNCLNINHISGAIQVIRAFCLKLDLHIVTPSKNPFSYNNINFNDIALLNLVPYQLKILSKKYTSELKSIKYILIGGARIDKQLRKWIITNNLENIYETYGMTETLSHIALKRTLSENVFNTLEGVSIFTKEKQLVINDQQLDIKNLITNDLVKIINNKQFKWLGRIDNVINSGGVKHIVEVLEEKISPNISNNSFFIFSRKDSSLGESINLIIESNHRLKLNFDGITKYEIPKNIYYLDSFIRTENNKINRKKNGRITNT